MNKANLRIGFINNYLQAMLRFINNILLLAFMVFFVNCSDAADINAGRIRAAQCAVCHGASGMSVMAEAPNLAGQSEIYLAEQLRYFRSGKRSNEIMNLLAKPLSDQEIDELAAWFSSNKVELIKMK